MKKLQTAFRMQNKILKRASNNRNRIRVIRNKDYFNNWNGVTYKIKWQEMNHSMDTICRENFPRSLIQ
jgi:hypothetical protein